MLLGGEVEVKIDELFTNYDCIEATIANGDDFSDLLIRLLETFDDEDRQAMLAIFAQSEFEYLKN